ncbi:PqqD family protein [Nocardioides sp. R1-1]|uniref:PqqD family protein n=1 Tax=Nocardioides sp. R1-1 TaxID=3383502 RepID=UPI0038D15C81
MRRAERPERWVRDSALHAVEMGEEFVMMGLAQGEYYAVKGVAASLWRHLAEPHDLAELCALVAAEYDVSADGCRDDVAAFLGQLRERRMVLAAS